MAPSTTQSELSSRVKMFVAEFCGVAPEHIHDYTTLFGDLGIDGNDADDFFGEFFHEFSVDLSSLDLSRHFGPEGMVPWAPLMWITYLFNRGSPETKAGLVAIAIADLEETVKCGEWRPKTC